MSKETIDSIFESIASYGMKVMAAILILIVGLWLARKVEALFVKSLTKKEFDATLVSFFANILHGAIVVFVIVAAISKIGVETTSFAALVASAGLAIGLALQGSLSNFAAGVLLILFKPFQVGDAIKTDGETGVVVEVGLLATELKTFDNIKLVMPNSTIMNGAITNFSANPTRRIDLTIGVGYGDDLNKAQKIILDLIKADERILEDPEPQVLVTNLGESSVDFSVRPWVNSADFWSVKCDLTKNIKETFDAEEISIPFPQRDVHLIQEKIS
ncbi:MAG: small conductance mechanosensitive channel [Zhongshania aliphaticivorans]|jgi:small conductance mechanosensitive channel